MGFLVAIAELVVGLVLGFLLGRVWERRNYRGAVERYTAQHRAVLSELAELQAAMDKLRDEVQRNR
jgi:uncharacterized membrane-anchored protein YhcB (DUF1043 family)